MADTRITVEQQPNGEWYVTVLEAGGVLQASASDWREALKVAADMASVRRAA